MQTPFIALLAALVWALPLSAQREGSSGQLARAESTPPIPPDPPPAAPAAGAQPQGMDRVLALREAGMEQWRAGRFGEATAQFQEALRVLDSLPPAQPGHGTIGFFPHYLLFMPPLNF